MGAHTLGRAFEPNSGYEGSFTTTSGFGYNLFNTQYYKNMLMVDDIEYRNVVSRKNHIFWLTFELIIILKLTSSIAGEVP